MYMGNTMPGFISVDCFMALISPLMEKLRAPVEELLDQVGLILKNTGLFFIQEIFQNKESVKDALNDLFLKLLSSSKENCLYLLTNFIDCQVKVVFTKDPQYIMNAYTWPDDDNRVTSSKQQETSTSAKISKNIHNLVQAGKGMFKKNESE